MLRQSLFTRIILALLLTSVAGSLCAQIDTLVIDAGATDIILQDTVKYDTTIAGPDSIDTGGTVLTTDTLIAEAEEEVIGEIITYPALDSTVYDIKDQRVRMYRGAKVTYGQITLEADYIEYDFLNGSVLAFGSRDTSGAVVGRPLFTESGQAFTADTIRYNFETKKGIINTVRTNDGESYVHAERSKKQENDHIHNLGGKFTTCDREKPHYHFRFNKMVVIPEDKVITGPVYMKIGKVPTPLALPFGFFPNTTEQKAGILIPSYGFTQGLGYFLIDGGYYLPINDNWDTKLTGDIYSRGSWGARNITRYTKRYGYTGNADLQFTNILTGDRELEGFSKAQSFFVRWRHTQDAKARPGTSFSGNVNVGTTNNFTNNFNSSQSDFISNNFSSGINYGRRFSNSQLTLSVRHSQNTRNRNFNLTLPQLSYNLNRFFVPLGWLSGDAVRSSRLDKKVGVTYSANFRNTLSTTEPELRFDNIDRLRTQFVNGVSHDVSANTSIKLGYFSLNPRARGTMRNHFAKRDQNFDSETMSVLTDTVGGFFTTYDYNFGTDLTTKIYGMATFKGDGIQAIRHVLTPTIGYTYAPEQSFIDTYRDTVSVIEYNPFVASAFPQGNSVKRSSIDFGLQNSLEMKVLTGKDSIPTAKKIKIIENLRINTNYNLAAEEFKLAIVSMSARTTLYKSINLQYTGQFDPYDVDNEGNRIDRLRVSNGGGLWRNTRNSVSLNTSFSGGKGDKKKKDPADLTFADDNELEEIENNREDFVDFTIPWSLNVSYTLNTTNSFDFTEERGLIDTTIISQHGLMFNGDFRLFEKWKIGFNSGYDLKSAQEGNFFNVDNLTPTTLTLSWDLHCWEFSGNFIPFGLRKSYNVRIGVKAAVLRDLKLQQRGNLGAENRAF